jgi:hypothetical protein
MSEIYFIDLLIYLFAIIICKVLVMMLYDYYSTTLNRTALLN